MTEKTPITEMKKDYRKYAQCKLIGCAVHTFYECLMKNRRSECPKITNRSMTVQEAGRKGGNKTVSTHGIEFFQEIGRKGGSAKKHFRGE